MNYRGGRNAFKSREKDRLIGQDNKSRHLRVQRSNSPVKAATRVEDLVTGIIMVTVTEIGSFLGREGLGRRGN